MPTVHRKKRAPMGFPTHAQKWGLTKINLSFIFSPFHFVTNIISMVSALDDANAFHIEVQIIYIV